MQPGIARAYGNLPMTFEPNRGQTDPSVKFLSRGLGYQLFLTQGKTVLSLKPHSTGMAQRTAKNESPSSAVLSMALAGANASAQMVGVDELRGKSNYLIGQDPGKWHTQIPNYRKVALKQVYPGIDLVYYGQGRQLEYDFVLAPGADPKAISLDVEADSVRAGTGERHSAPQIDSNGDLVVHLVGGDVRFHLPLIYQPVPDSSIRTIVDGRYILRPSTRGFGNAKSGNRRAETQNSKWEVGFEIASYDATKPLIIDPVLSYSTYLGGNAPGTPGTGLDAANAIAVSGDGSAFIAGETDSLDFPTVHALQPEAGGPSDFPDDAFVSKISPDGSTLLYSTYLGGSKQDRAAGIAVDSFGNAYVTGTTLSADFPASLGAADPNCGNDGQCDATTGKGLLKSDAFATKLNPEGSAIVYSTFISNIGPLLVDSTGKPVLDSNGNLQYLGANDRGFGIAVDLNGVAYVVGTTDGADQAGPFFGGGNDCFLAKISATGSTFQFFTGAEDTGDFGGSLEDQALGVAVDNVGHAFLTGVTYSPNFPVTGATAFQPALAGDADAFFMEIDTTKPVGASIVYSTYLGGAGRDYGTGIALDAAGNAYVTGVTNSTVFPVTAGVVRGGCALDISNNCEGDVFVSKLNPAAAGHASLVYSTYVGGKGADYGAGIALDRTGNTYVTGYTNSTDFPSLGVPFQATYGGGNTDAFIFKLNPTATALIYSSFLGGSNAEDGRGVAVDVNGNAYVAGQTCSTDFPTARPLQGAPAGNCDAFVAKVRVGPDIDVKPTTLAFGAQAVTTTSTSQTVTVTSIGDSPLNIGAITVSGDFVIQSDSCSNKSLVNKGDNCAVQIAFKPASIGPRNGQVLIPNNVNPGPFAVSLTGLGTTLSISPVALVFGNQGVGSTAATQPVTMTNTGGAAIAITSIVASGDFAENDTCGNSLAGGASCIISVSFTPTAIGTRTGSITITDVDPTSPQIVSLIGHGTSPGTGQFTLSANPTTATTFAGTAATYTLVVTPSGGFNSAVALSCSIPFALSKSTCTVTPSSVTPDGIHPVTATVTVVTTARTMTPPGPGFDLPGSLGPISTPWLIALFAMAIISSLIAARRRPWVVLTVVMLFVLLWAGCGGGMNPVNSSAGTPAGTYTLTLTGTSGAASNTTSVALTVN